MSRPGTVVGSTAAGGDVGTIGVGGAVIKARVSGMHDADVTDPAIQA